MFTIGGGSAAKPPEISSSDANTVVTEKTSPTTSSPGIEETSPSPHDFVIDEAAPAPKEIPQPFQGDWNSTLEQCGSQAGDTRLVIDAKRIQFHESEGLIQDISTDGQRKLTGKIELSGEGETWLSDIDFQLSEDYKALTAITDGSSFVRYRCS